MNNIKVENIEDEEKYMTGVQECKEEEIPTDISTDWSSNKNTPERCVRPLSSQDHTEENHSVPQEDQEEYLSILKVEDIKEEEETYVMDDQLCREEEIPRGISTGMYRERSDRDTPSSYYSSPEETESRRQGRERSSQLRRRLRDERTSGTTRDPDCLERPTPRANQVSTKQEDFSEEDSGGASEPTTARKKTRKPRFTESENCALVEGVEASYEQLYGRRAQTTPSATKRKLWASIAEKVAACSGKRRDVRTCQKRYSDCCRQTRRKLGEEAQSTRRTGGGPSFQPNWLPWEEILKRRVTPTLVTPFGHIIDSSRAGTLPAEEEASARRQRFKRRRDDTASLSILLPRRTSPVMGTSPAQIQTSRSIVTEEPAGVTDVTFHGFESSRAEASIPSQEVSQEARPRSAPGASAPQEEQEMTQTSTGLASCIGPFYTADLHGDLSEDDDKEEDQPATHPAAATLPTALATQVRTVHHLQRGRDQAGLDRVHSLATEMNKEQSSFRDAVVARLSAMESQSRRMADTLMDIQKAKAAEAKARHEEHIQLLGVLNILATSMTKLVEQTTCISQTFQSLETSQRQAASAQTMMATALQTICDRLTGPGHQHVIPQLPIPPPPSQTPPVQAPPGSWYGQSQLYHGYTGQYPVFQMPPPPTQPTAQRTSRHKKKKRKSAAPEVKEEEDQDSEEDEPY